MGFSSENHGSLSVFRPLPLNILYDLPPSHVDGSVVKLKGVFGVCYFDLLLGSISLKCAPVQYTIYFQPEGSLSHLGKGEQHCCIIYFTLPSDISIMIRIFMFMKKCQLLSCKILLPILKFEPFDDLVIFPG